LVSIRYDTSNRKNNVIMYVLYVCVDS
jgi:hypothetical protein